jgi:hypothetical protein
MISEFGVMLVLGLTGFLALGIPEAISRSWSRVWMAIPVGTFIYMAMALLSVLILGRLSVPVALTATGAVALAAASRMAVLRRWTGRDLVKASTLALSVLAVVALSREIPLTRLTEDSMQNLFLSFEFQMPNALPAIPKAPLLARQIGIPSLHALSSLTDLRYIPSLGPLFGMSTVAVFVWFSLRPTTRSPHRLWLVMMAIAFLLASNRFLYSWFYVNSHIQMAAYVLLGLIAAWLAVCGSEAWASVSGISLAAMLLFRPDSPALVALLMVVIASTRPSENVARRIALPPVAVAILWIGFVLFRYSEYAGDFSLASPVFGGLVSVIVGAVALLSVSWKFTHRLAEYYGVILLAGMAVALAAAIIADPATAWNSLAATLQNSIEGFWYLTWWIMAMLIPVAIVVHRVQRGRLWTQAVVGMGILFWLLPLIRDGAYRVGPGDSGVRILIHFLPAFVTFLVLAADSRASYDSSGFSARARKAAISARVTGTSGQ